MVRQAVVLAGGRGRRLGALTDTVPKPLLPCGGRPFLAWVAGALCGLGVRDVVLLTGYLGEQVAAAVPGIVAGLPADVRVRCVREAAPAGTGGALKQAADVLEDRFLLCNGDSWLDFDFLDVLADFSPGQLGRMVLRRVEDTGRYGVVTCVDGVVTGFAQQAEVSGPGLVNAGIYLFDRGMLAAVPEVGSLEAEVLPGLAAKGLLGAVVAEGYFVDIGVKEDLARAGRELPGVLAARWNGSWLIN
jgi:D-glycero-D-manno-heptose 1,7-bisphosphate phosphatase